MIEIDTQKLYPNWLLFKEPYQDENGKWICPYCNNSFETKEKAYPKLVMTFDYYQKRIRDYKELQDTLEAHWYFYNGHPCIPFSSYFWGEYEKLKTEREKRFAEFMDKIKKMESEKYLKNHESWYSQRKFELTKFGTSTTMIVLGIIITIIVIVIVFLALMALIK